MELLSWDQLDAEGERAVRSFLGAVGLVELTPTIREASIRIRRRTGLKLPDAIVAGSAIAIGATLLTADERLIRTPGLKAATLKLKS